MPSIDPNKYAPTTWGQDPTVEITVPSGQTCLVRRVGPTTLMQAGLLDAADLLSQIAGGHIDRVKGKMPPTDADVAAVLRDPKQVTAALTMIDKLVCVVVAEPQVHPVPDFKAGESRVAGRVYTDMIDENDKTYIMRWAMEGQAKVAPFREGHGPAAGIVDDVKTVPSRARKSAPRAARRADGVLPRSRSTGSR